MAVTSMTRDGMTAFARYDDMAAGNSTSPGVFAFADNTSTYRVSSDGSSWTGYSLTIGNSQNPRRLIYFPSQGLWKWFASDSPQNGATYTTSVLNVKLQSRQYTDIISVDTQNPFLETGSGLRKVYSGSSSNAAVWDFTAAYRYGYDSSPYNVALCRPAYDGANTWAISDLQSATYHWNKYVTGAGTSGDGIIPFSWNNAGSGYATWSDYSPPSTQSKSDIFYWQGYWFIANYIDNTIYRTANIATASPTWTSVGTPGGTYYNIKFWAVNGELWLTTTSGGALSTMWKISTPTGSLTSVTMPSAKNVRTPLYGNGVYVFICSDGTVLRSTTGASGSFSSVNTGSTNVAYYSGGFGPL